MLSILSGWWHQKDALDADYFFVLGFDLTVESS
jgi:hypothetical protein